MKRILSLVVVMGLLLSVGCGQIDNNNATVETSSHESSNNKAVVTTSNESNYDSTVENSNQATNDMATEETTEETAVENSNTVEYDKLTQAREPSRGETYAKVEENEFVETGLENTSTFSIDVDTASYANLRDILQSRQIPQKESVRIEEMINYFDYDYKEPVGDEPFSLTLQTTDSPWSEGHVIAQIGVQGKSVDRQMLPPSNIVMLIDVSGSMQDHNKLPLLKKAFAELTSNLTAKDRVSIVVYAGAAGLVLDGAEGSDNETIMSALNRLEAGGSTAGGEGIELAYELAEDYFIEGGNNRIVLASDGDFNVGMSSVNDLERLIEEKRETGVFLSVVGFGRDNIRDDVMEGLADKGNGNYSYIDTFREAKKVFGTEFVGTMFTIAKDVKIQVSFNNNLVSDYRLIGYENRMLANEDFEDDTKDAGELGIGHEVTALYELRLREGVDKSTSDLYEVELRYKEPAGTQSKAVTVDVGARYVDYRNLDADFKWSLVVAEFGLLLKESEYKGTANTESILTRASEVLQTNYDDYKVEFVGMVKDYDYMVKEGIITQVNED